MFTESKSHYIQALAILGRDNSPRDLQRCLDAEKRLKQCFSEENNNERHSYKPPWKCFRSKAPDLKEIEMKMASSTTEANKTDSLNTNDPKLLSVSNNILRLKYTGSAECGWTMEVTRNVSTGNVKSKRNILSIAYMLSVGVFL